MAESTTKIDLVELYKSELLSDVTIQLKGETIRAHRTILAKHSVWFAKMFKKDPEYDSKVVIDASNDDPLAMRALIYFCYAGNHDCYLDKMSKPIDSFTEWGPTQKSIMFNIIMLQISVYGLAVKYDVTGIRLHMLRAFSRIARAMLDDGYWGLLTILNRAYAVQPHRNALRTASIELFNQYLRKWNEIHHVDDRVSRRLELPESALKLLFQISIDAEHTQN
ncbi:hypothetical protein K504DRAFT_528670 [Pleomassaria siparia CBS 279.74]|uniref:BTB domain-containing protein n=1 Tax=Pleomassaria siparia CBS 279.74 TaxID=1314801 RepID=A0A6G1KPR4_9PLEO|nr:hypothetical protein K504DRAFT_528670 [Pleomassaria siparia CBS 279.74]